MTAPVTDALLRRIAKLHAHAESAAAIGNEAEALAYMDRVAALTGEHMIALEDALAAGELAEGQHTLLGATWVSVVLGRQPWMKGRAADDWEVRLAHAVAKAHGCAARFDRQHNDVAFFGRKHAIHAACHTYDRIVIFAEAECRRAAERTQRQWLTERGHGLPANWRAGWRLGFSVGVAMRVAQNAGTLGRGTELVSRAHTEAETFAEQHTDGEAERRVTMADYPTEAVQGGYEAGERQSVEQQSLGGGA